MTVGSFFSGIGGFDLGLSGFDVRWQVERDGDCLKVLAKHWPRVRRYRDIHAVIQGRHQNRMRHGLTLKPVDVIVGGFPCQDLSVAGKREGLGGARSSLFFVFMRAVRMLKPRVVLIENVPGLFSSQRGRDFYTVLSALAERGYFWAYRVLDSQYFGVAQRRRRVFIVGCHRTSGLDPAAILFESASGNGHSAARGASGPDLAGPVAGGAYGTGRRDEDDPNLVYTVHGENSCAMTGNGSAAVARRVGVVRCLDTTGGYSHNQGGSLVASGERARALTASMHKRHDEDTDTLIAFDTTNLTSRENRANPQAGDPCHPLSASAHPPTVATCLRANSGRNQIESTYIASALTASAGHHGHSSPRGDGSDNLVTGLASVPLSHAERLGITADARGQTNSTPGHNGVRRLTPLECERLQGFPDGWTCLCGCEPYSTAACACSDSYRYRALGNAVTVPVIAWIAHRLRAGLERVEGAA